MTPEEIKALIQATNHQIKKYIVAGDEQGQRDCFSHVLQLETLLLLAELKRILQFIK